MLFGDQVIKLVIHMSGKNILAQVQFKGGNYNQMPKQIDN